MFGRAAIALRPSMGVRVLHIVFCAIALLSPVHAARKPRCTADERLCPLEYGSTRYIVCFRLSLSFSGAYTVCLQCVERDSVSNCGGCSANGSGQNCEDIDAAAGIVGVAGRVDKPRAYDSRAASASCTELPSGERRTATLTACPEAKTPMTPRTPAASSRPPDSRRDNT